MGGTNGSEETWDSSLPTEELGTVVMRPCDCWAVLDDKELGCHLNFRLQQS